MMKNLYKSLYISAGVLFLIVLLGGSLSKPLFDSMSESTLESAGIKKAYVTAADDKIDDMFYMIRKIEYQVERIKKFFSSDRVDESKYQRENNNLIANNVYNPLQMTLNFVYRFGFFLISLMVFFGGIIVQLIYRSMDLRRRLSRLESLVAANA